MKNVLKPVPKSVLTTLGLSAAVIAANLVIHRKMFFILMFLNNYHWNLFNNKKALQHLTLSTCIMYLYCIIMYLTLSTCVLFIFLCNE